MRNGDSGELEEIDQSEELVSDSPSRSFKRKQRTKNNWNQHTQGATPTTPN
jgi:hypothetical protein